MRLIAFATILPLAAASIAYGAPDEAQLGKASGYPVGNASNWYYAESVRVGSFTHEAEIPGIFRGRVNVLKPSSKPMALPKAAREPELRWRIFPGERRRFALLGVYGQSIFVDPELKLVIVQTGANATAEAGKSSLGPDRQAFWKGVVSFYGKW